MNTRDINNSSQLSHQPSFLSDSLVSLLLLSLCVTRVCVSFSLFLFASCRGHLFIVTNCLLSLCFLMASTAVRFGRVPKREKAKILAAMQKVNMNSMEKLLNAQLEDENRLLSTILQAHDETCDYTKDKVAPLVERARSQPVFAACSPQMVSVARVHSHFHCIFLHLALCLHFFSLSHSLTLVHVQGHLPWITKAPHALSPEMRENSTVVLILINLDSYPILLFLQMSLCCSASTRPCTRVSSDLGPRQQELRVH